MRCANKVIREDQELRLQMHRIWTNFARHGFNEDLHDEEIGRAAETCKPSLLLEGSGG